MSEKYTAGPSKMASSAPSKPERAPKITYGASPAKGYPAKYFVDPASVPRFRYGGGKGPAA